jgi:hypothetical protein
MLSMLMILQIFVTVVDSLYLYYGGYSALSEASNISQTVDNDTGITATVLCCFPTEVLVMSVSKDVWHLFRSSKFQSLRISKVNPAHFQICSATVPHI